MGEKLGQMAGLKRVTMELGSNSPLIVMHDADLAKVAKATIATGYGNAGQVCISTQRVIVMEQVYDEFLSIVRPQVEALRYGDQLDPNTQMGPMIREADAARVESWIKEAAAGGARVVAGGGRKGVMVEPTLVADVRPDMRISCDELFGPAVAVTRAGSIDEAIRMANDSRYGLSAGVFTQNIDWAVRFAREVDSGNIHINWGPGWRGPDAVRRAERERDGQGRPEVRHRRNDRIEDRRDPRELGGLDGARLRFLAGCRRK